MSLEVISPESSDRIQPGWHLDFSLVMLWADITTPGRPHEMVNYRTSEQAGSENWEPVSVSAAGRVLIGYQQWKLRQAPKAFGLSSPPSVRASISSLEEVRGKPVKPYFFKHSLCNFSHFFQTLYMFSLKV